MSKDSNMTRILEKVSQHDDLSILSSDEKTAYYQYVCESLGLNPATKPLAYIEFENGRTILYALKNATDQLRSIHKISVSITHREKIGHDVYLVVAKAITPDGRTDEAIGAVALKDAWGNMFNAYSIANAIMHAETKAKRRVTLSICGVSLLDETEVQDMKQAERMEREKREKQKALEEKKRLEQESKEQQVQAKNVQQTVSSQAKNNEKNTSTESIIVETGEVHSMTECKGENNQPYQVINILLDDGKDVDVIVVGETLEAIKRENIQKGQYLTFQAKKLQKGIVMLNYQVA